MSDEVRRLLLLLKSAEEWLEAPAENEAQREASRMLAVRVRSALSEYHFGWWAG